MKLAFGVLLIVVVIYLGVEFIPAYWGNYEFQDAIKNEALMATNGSQSEDVIRDAVFKKAQELDIPLEKDDIKVSRSGSYGSGSVSIEAPYVVHVNLPGMPTDLHFNPSTTNRGVF
ncbi:MAG TPA: hypothetical protein VGF06_00730 [Terriglobales bacterium]